MKTLRRSLALALAALVLAGCTLISPNASPIYLSQNKFAFGLLDKTIPGTPGVRVRFITQPVYIVDATGHLAPSSRIVPSPPKLETVIGQLLLGPTAIERSAGYSSALPKALVLIGATVRNHLGYANFATSLRSLPRTQQLLAIGQLVLTANEAGATRGLVVRVAGTNQALWLPNGTQATVATPRDFDVLLND